MLDSTDSIKPDQIIELILKHRWFIIIPFCLSMITGIYLSIVLPKTYKAKTLILIEAQSVPENYVRSIVSTSIESRINTIAQQIMSRTNLERIINDFKLFSGPKYENMYLEDKIENTRKRISVETSKSDKRNVAEKTHAFSISFIGEQPDVVMRITNSLASYFINENLKVRETQAIGTNIFLKNELKNMRSRLEKVENYLKEYREKYMGALPEQLETNLSIMDRLQQQLMTKEEVLRYTEIRRIDLEKEIQQAQNLLKPAGGDQSGSNNLLSLEKMKEQLANMQTRYTEQHPDVIRLKKKIEASTELTQELESSGNATGLDPRFLKKRNSINLAIKNLKTEISNLKNRINIYQKRVEDTPKREQELMSLRRDYQNIQASYTSLLNKKLEAEIAVNMEKKQKGERFRIIDSARLPQKPISPDIKKIFGLSLAAGLGIGSGLIFLFFYFDTSFRRSEEIESFLEVPVLATLATIYHPKDIKKQRLHMVVSLFSILISFGLLAAFAVLTIKGVDQTIAFVGRFINI